MVDYDPTTGSTVPRRVTENVDCLIPGDLRGPEELKAAHEQLQQEAEGVHRRALKWAILEYILRVRVLQSTGILAIEQRCYCRL